MRVVSASSGSFCLEAGWDHAWNLNAGPDNHDALWVFLKGRTAGSSFHHVKVIGANPVAGMFDIQVEPDSMGVFLTMPSGHSGTTGALSFCLEIEPHSWHEIRAFGIEMVKVNPGPFHLGDGTSNGAFGSPSGQPVQVVDESEFPATALVDTGLYAPSGNIPEAWPKGTLGFHCMKYEISIIQYADFLNTLDFSQQIARTQVAPDAAVGSWVLSGSNIARNGLRIMSSGSAAGRSATYGVSLEGGTFNDGLQGENRACNWLKWNDLAAYLDWAGLRPMTEWEFEKACRGPLPSLPGEFAWGTVGVVDANTLVGDGTISEAVNEQGDGLTGLASHGYSGPQGPLRTGFAATSATGRVESGASYWGMMEMSGNLWEQCVTVNAAGLAFTGRLGDGILDASGEANQPGWPNQQGAGFRGGGWNSGILPGFRDLAVSDRFYAGLSPSTRRSTSGGRGVR
jgi:formylglycine-generating enzyme required for sulfatase activity